jgi:nitrogen regulatory protein PII-like uncharacterized protein
MKTFNEFIKEDILTESEKKLAKIAADIQKRKGLLDLAAEKRRMSKGSRRHFRSNAEVNHENKIRELEQKHEALKKSMNESLQESLSSKEGVHKAGVDRLANAYIKHGVTHRNYSDKVTNSPRKYRVMSDHEDKIESHINALPDVSKVRDRMGKKESEEMLNKIRYDALTKATDHYKQKHGYDD